MLMTNAAAMINTNYTRHPELVSGSIAVELGTDAETSSA
jgi:hypothetical protein